MAIVTTICSDSALGCNLKNERLISLCLQSKLFKITVIQVYASTTNGEEAEIEWFSEDLEKLAE